MNNNLFKSYIKAEIGVLITIVALSIMLISKSILMTIPFIIITSFVLSWIGVKSWTIYITAIAMHIILGITTSKWISIILLPNTIIDILGGFLFAKYLKRLIEDKKQIKNIALTILSLVLIYGGVVGHMNILGSPYKYLKAKEGVQQYIDDTYEGKLKIEKVRYSSKMNEFICDVQSIEDARNKGSIYYGRGHIYDDYHFRIEEKQALQAKQIIKTMLKQRTDIPVADIRHIGTDISLPYNKYTPQDMYLGKEPINVKIKLEPDSVEDRYEYKEKYGKLPERHSYKDIVAFSKEAYKVLKILEEIDYPYKSIEIESYLPDGERSYNITIKGLVKINSLNDVLDITHIEEGYK